MIPVSFLGQNIVLGADQPEYQPLPAYIGGEPTVAITCWELTPEDLATINRTGRIWATQMTFGEALQPQVLEADRPARLPEQTAHAQ